MLSSWTLVCAVATVIPVWDLLFGSGLLYSRDFIFPYGPVNRKDPLLTVWQLAVHLFIHINKSIVISSLSHPIRPSK
jgi:hypothetical protein